MRIIALLLLLVCGSLIGCLRQPIVTVTNLPACQVHCQERLTACKANCRNNCRLCDSYAEKQAILRYFTYQHEEFVEGGYIARDLQSFRDPLQCRKTTCDCPADYNMCMQACRGVILKEVRKAPNC